MQNLLDFLARHFHWLIFLLLEAVSGTLLFSYNSYQGSVWITTANSMAGKAMEMQADIEQYFYLKRLNEELSQRNLVLEQRVQLLNEKTGRETENFGLKLIPAKVVSNTVNRRDNLITIDLGRADGVHPDMGVVSGLGIVGVVYMAGEHYSIVLPVLNSRSSISCSVRGRDYFGYLTWYGGNPVEAYVEDIPRHAKFQKGDWVETSGYSAIFPKGIAVGKIIGIYNSHDGLSYSLKVHLATDFACLRDVYVITDESLREQQLLQTSAQDSLALTQ